MSRGEHVDVERREPSGAGALGGLVAGGLLGSPYGPPGVLVGGVPGNAAEYQNLKNKRQEGLQEAAWNVIRSQAPQQPRTGEFVEQRDGRDDCGEYWAFEFVDERNVRHFARLYLDEGKIVYSGRDE